MTQKLRTELIDCNDGQVAGLPRNPRKISDKMFERLKRSLSQSPEMLDLRPLIVFPHGGRYVAIGGNMRLLAVKDMGWEEVPCNVLSPDTPPEKLAEYTIKDNNAYGEDDMDILAEEWADFPMDDFDKDFGGFEVDPNDYGSEFSLPSGEKPPFQQMTFTFADEQAERVKEALRQIKEQKLSAEDNFGNENSNANALFYIVSVWDEQRK